MVAQTGAGDVDRIGREGDRPLRLHKIVESYTELGSEVEDARAPIGSEKVRRIFVVGPYQAAGALCPGNKAPLRGKIPPENDGSNAHTGKRSAAIRQIS